MNLRIAREFIDMRGLKCVNDQPNSSSRARSYPTIICYGMECARAHMIYTLYIQQRERVRERRAHQNKKQTPESLLS